MKINNVSISNETFEALMSGRCVEGSLRLQTTSNGQQEVAFRAYQRSTRRRERDRVVVELENGWLKESPRRFKFFNSVKKQLPQADVEHAMRRDLSTAMNELLWQRMNLTLELE